MPEFSFHHGGISVPNLDDAIDWYARVLGFKVEKRFVINAANAKAAMIRKGPLRIELFEVVGAAPLPPDRRNPSSDLMTHGNKHIAFCIANLDSFLGHAEEMQADVALVVREAFGKGCFLRDCAGNLIEFVEEANN